MSLHRAEYEASTGPTSDQILLESVSIWIDCAADKMALQSLEPQDFEILRGLIHAHLRQGVPAEN